MKYALFYMPKDRSTHIIERHNFYLEQAKKRLLSQFDDIENEADKYGEAKLDEYAAYYNPDADNAADLQEAAYEKMCNHYHMLGEMRDRTRLSVVAGMFHEWEKQLREWTTKEIHHWHNGESVKKAVWKEPLHKIIDLFESLGWVIKSQTYYTSLDRCRLVVNAYKHGDGGAFDEIRDKYPEFIYCSDPAYMQYADHTNLHVDDSHITEFSDAIISFWKAVPEYIWEKEELSVPNWFEKAFAKDQKIG
jgi:hypothetical protein